MVFRRFALAIALAAALAAPGLPTTAPVSAQGQGQGQNPNQPLNVPITQALAGVGNFTGQLAIDNVRVVNGQLAAVGTLTGRITDTAGNLLGTVATAVTVPVSNLNGSCSVLHLTLGPLDLDLLGLQVHLDQVVLDISAQPGAGNLLGNLLCSVANLLNGGTGPLQQIAALLNQILGAL